MRKQIIIGMGIILLIALLTGCFQVEEPGPGTGPEEISFQMDSDARTINVIEVPENLTGMTWDDITIIEGSGALPSGAIDVGDTITNCSSGLIIVKVDYPSGYSPGYSFTFYDLDEESNKFIGNWSIEEPGEGIYSFYSNGTFVKNQTGFASAAGTWKVEFTEDNGFDPIYGTAKTILILNDTTESIHTYQFQNSDNTLNLHNVYTKENIVLTRQ
jgi:hypothetical protein